MAAGTITLTYSTISNDSTSATIRITMTYYGNGQTWNSSPSPNNCQITLNTTKYFTHAYTKSTSAQTMGYADFTINKSHNAQSLVASGKINNYSTVYDDPTASCTISVSAQTSYTVSYNANGGTGAPASQTKWHGESLTLSSTIPTRTNYNFLGWATSASATTPTYCTGPNHSNNTTYTGNGALSLYAVWELSYVPSTFTSMVAYRCDVDENLKDDGTYGYLSFAWEPGTYRGTSVYVKPIIKYKLNSASTYTTLDSLTISNNSVSVKIGSALNPLTEYQYDVLFILEDYDGPYDGSLINGRSSTLINTITYATFISPIACVMDINASGTAIGLLGYVDDNVDGVFVKGIPLYAWTEIGSGSNPNSDPNFEITFNSITNYNEVMIVADIERLNVHHLLTVSIPAVRISANSGSTTEIKLGGGQGVSADTNCGAWGEITTTSFTPVAAAINRVDYKASTTWYIYAR